MGPAAVRTRVKICGITRAQDARAAAEAGADAIGLVFYPPSPRFLSTERAKAVTRGINERCRTLRPYAELLVDGFGIPEQLRDAEMLHPERILQAD